MFFGLILSRILFIACMVLIIGYVFGSFSKKPRLVTLTKIASILVIVLFISANAFRFGGWRQHYANEKNNSCWNHTTDSVGVK